MLHIKVVNVEKHTYGRHSQVKVVLSKHLTTIANICIGIV